MGDPGPNLNRQPDVAVCGIAIRLPGGIRTTEEFWNVLVNGRDTRGPVPKDRYSTAAFSGDLGVKDRFVPSHGYFLQEDLGALDPSFFNMTKAEIEQTDPQQRMLLEVVRDCLDNAGEIDHASKTIGCFVASFTDDWAHMVRKEPIFAKGYAMTGSTDMMLANRISHEFNFRGPSVVVKTGCSASLVALHEACRAIQAGDCDAAVVASANLIMAPDMTFFMSADGVLSKDGSCKTFDASANGFARAESVSAVYIKKCESATDDKNPVRAIIRGTASNCDGRSTTLTAPSSVAHEALMAKAYRNAGLDPHDTPFVELHGTGTAVVRSRTYNFQLLRSVADTLFV
jgi:acyl transferase domain-containing protein